MRITSSAVLAFCLFLPKVGMAHHPAGANVAFHPRNTTMYSHLSLQHDFPDVAGGPTGEFRAILFRDSNRLCYEASFQGLGQPTGLVIRWGPVDKAGSAVLQLAALNSGTSGTCVKLSTHAMVRLMNLTDLYSVQALAGGHLVPLRGQMIKTGVNTPIKELGAGSFTTDCRDPRGCYRK